MSNDAINTIRNILGMRPDYMTEALDQVELADNIGNLTLKTEHLTRALIFANLAVAEGLTLNRHTNEWAGMEGNES